MDGFYEEQLTAVPGSASAPVAYPNEKIDDMKYSICVTLFILSLQGCRQHEEDYITVFPGKPAVPSSILEEHAYLLGKIYPLTILQDSAGLAAVQLYELMQYHFKEEEEYILPPLGVLPALASGKVPEKRLEIMQLIQKFSSRLAVMSAEHQQIKAHMDELKRVAGHQMLPEILETEKRLHAHARLEEEILFPAVLLIGDYLKVAPESGK